MLERITSTLLATLLSAVAAAGCDPEAISKTAVTPTSAALASAARTLEGRDGAGRSGTDDRDGDGDDDRRDQTLRVAQLRSLLDDLRPIPALQPLFVQYGVPNPIRYDARARGLVELLGGVRLRLSFGTLTITNRETDGVVYAAPVIDLASGSLQPEHLPLPALSQGTATAQPLGRP